MIAGLKKDSFFFHRASTMQRQRLIKLTAITASLACGIAIYLGSSLYPAPANEQVLGHGNIETLNTVYANWRSGYERVGGNAQTLRLPLAYSPNLSTTSSSAHGVFDLNLLEGTVKVTVNGLDGKDGYAVWLIDNQPGGTLKPETGDTLINLGELESNGISATLETRLNPLQLLGFKLDRVAITRKGETPVQNLVLTGAPGLLQQLYYSEQYWPMAQVGGIEPATRITRQKAAFEFLLPKPANASGNPANPDDALQAQIAQGRALFLNETFGGNGRTCATCHRQENNFTINPKFIATLPPSDPLFIAETNPNLADLDNPTLLRQLGLIKANVDGFDKPGVFRAVPHTLALNTSITTELMTMGGDFPQDGAFANALGWSGDGAPGTGSLREFALGAIKQHLPKTLNRVAGVDFRLPTDEELTALEAFQLSLGRAKDYNLAQLTFVSPIVQRGKTLFDTKQNPVVNGQVVLGETANCNGCHQNAGAISSTTHANPTRDTGVENMGDQSARLLNPSLPTDGGFGQTERTNCGGKHDQTCFGDGRFNTTTVIEAADTEPFFHNNSVSTVEEAVGAYNGDGFNNSPGSLTSKGFDRRIKLGSTQVVAVALFLRSINAVENIRSSNQLDRQAMGLTGSNSQEVLKLAMYETKDAIRVLQEGVLSPYPQAVNKLLESLKLETLAYALPSPLRNQYIQNAINSKREALGLIVTCDPNAPVPVTSTSPMFTCGELG
jgi:cytochrome c peroxidase